MGENVTDKQRAVIQMLSPVTTAVLFGFFLYASKEFIQTVRADQAVHSAQIRELEQTIREKSVQLAFVQSEMRDLKDTLRRIEGKIDSIKEK
jgi:septal ring factor EnvC (AmiA/AmiB activator)